MIHQITVREVILLGLIIIAIAVVCWFDNPDDYLTGFPQPYAITVIKITPQMLEACQKSPNCMDIDEFKDYTDDHWDWCRMHPEFCPNNNNPQGEIK